MFEMHFHLLVSRFISVIELLVVLFDLISSIRYQSNVLRNEFRCESEKCLS